MGKDDEDFRELDELIDELGRDAGKPAARQLVAAEGYAGGISTAPDAVIPSQDEAEDVGDRSAGRARDVDGEGRSDPVLSDRDRNLRGEGCGVPLSKGMGSSMDLFEIHSRAMAPLQRKAWMESAAFPDPCGAAGERCQKGEANPPTEEGGADGDGG